jgi:hypothetical protein
VDCAQTAGTPATREANPQKTGSSKGVPDRVRCLTRTGFMTDRLLGSLEAVPTAEPFVGPDQIALEQLLVQMSTGKPQ